MDVIRIKELSARCVVGVNDWERKEKQDVIINVEIFTDLLKVAGKTDNIQSTIDYKFVKNEIMKIIESSFPYLVEKLAYDIADFCIRIAGVKRVDVEVDKPGALRFARSVSVRIKREWSYVFLGIGSNIEPDKNIELALFKILEIDGIRPVRISDFYITKPIGKRGDIDFRQPDFVNGVLKLETFWDRYEFENNVVARIEKELGREEKGTFSPRTIDLDVLLWIDSLGNTTFVHKDIFEKYFIASAIYDIDPNLIFLGKHIYEVKDQAKKTYMFKLDELSQRLKKILMESKTKKEKKN